MPTTYHFTGQREESLLGLYYYGARWYDPYLNRWVQSDTDVPESQEVQAFDRYAFVNNNPVRYMDPSGHSIWDVVVDFSRGFAYEFALTMPWATSPGTDVLKGSPSESTTQLAARVAGDAAAIILGTDLTIGGASGAAFGAEMCSSGVLCAAGLATVAVSATAVGVGIITTSKGTGNINQNLSRLAGRGNTGGGLFQKLGIITYNHFDQRLQQHGITEQEAYNAYQNGNIYTDAKGQWIKWDPKTKVTVVIDPTDGKVITVIGDVEKASSEWELGIFDYYEQYDKLFPK
jgi:RHS repeat-associated protein